jgi:hypothetical protein
MTNKHPYMNRPNIYGVPGGDFKPGIGLYHSFMPLAPACTLGHKFVCN